YVEAHGTGTILGDPIKLQALGAAYGPGRPAARPPRVGSIKTHLAPRAAAAGTAESIKAVLTVRDGVMPPQLHFRTPNPHSPWDSLPISVVTQPTSFGPSEHPRRAAVSSFGFSGTNVHVILEQPPQLQNAAATLPPRSVQVLPLS